MSTPSSSRRERVAWLALLGLAAAVRLWDLGGRMMSHDESLHAFFSFRLMAEGAYQHDPVYHGPFLYHLTALVFFLVGHTDATARLAPALTGVAIVASAWWWRGWIGRRAAWCAAVLIASSPTWLFYSRHIREDVFAAAFTAGWAYAFLRLLESRDVRWLTRLTWAMALAFVAKETAFITGAIFGTFAVFVAVWPRVGAVTRAAALDAAVAMLALVLPFAAGPLFLAFGWSPVGEEAVRRLMGGGGLVIGGLVAVGLAAGAWRFGVARWARLYAGFWGVVLVLLTTLLTRPAGVASGVVGSLGYWLTQQEVARAGQPWFYYGIVGLLYEPVTVLLGIAALGSGLHYLRSVDAPSLAPREGVEFGGSPLALALLAWWSFGALAGYAVAGERMPWLLLHQSLPLTLGAGWAAERLLSVRRDLRGEQLRLVLGTAAGVVSFVGVVLATPFEGRTLEAVSATLDWWTCVVVMLAAGAWALPAARRLPAPWCGRAVWLGLLLPLAAYTLRAAAHASFVSGELPTELISYAQAAPDVRRVTETIARIDERLGGHQRVRVVLDGETTWPFSWYLRRYPLTTVWTSTPPNAEDVDVLLAGSPNQAMATAWATPEFVHERAISYWWPLQDYRSLTRRTFGDLLVDGTRRRRLAAIVLRRDYGIPLEQWPARREFDLFVRRALLPSVSARATGVAWTPEPRPSRLPALSRPARDADRLPPRSHGSAHRPEALEGPCALASDESAHRALHHAQAVAHRQARHGDIGGEGVVGHLREQRSNRHGAHQAERAVHVVDAAAERHADGERRGRRDEAAHPR